jgi:hypothetical protein
MNIFLKVLKLKQYFLNERLWFSQFCLFVKEIENEVSACFYDFYNL